MTSKKKQAFTIRLDNEIIDNLNRISSILGLKPSTVARNYLLLSNYIITTPSMPLLTFDNTELQLLPKDLLREIFFSMPEDKQFAIGDSLGILINTNSALLNKNDIHYKISLIKGLGWVEIKQLGDEYGFSARDIPLGILHALIYRIVHNRKYPALWKKDFIAPYLGESDDHLKEIAKRYRKTDDPLKNIDSQIQQFKREVGGKPANFSGDCRYYTFTILKIPIPEKRDSKEKNQ